MQVRITAKGIINLYSHKVFVNLGCRVALLHEDASTAIVFEESHTSSRRGSWETDYTIRPRSSRISSVPDARTYSECPVLLTRPCVIVCLCAGTHTQLQEASAWGLQSSTKV